jgi:hypothetical protein
MYVQEYCDWKTKILEEHRTAKKPRKAGQQSVLTFGPRE